MNQNILSLRLMEKLSYAAIKFNMAGDDFYCVLKNRGGETGIIKTIPDVSTYEDNALITDFNDLSSRQKEDFINSLIETIS